MRRFVALNRFLGQVLRSNALTAPVVPRIRAARLYARYRDYTMVPRPRFLDNLWIAGRCTVPGAVVECGVWRGGMSAALAELLGPERHYYLLDSFEGLPPADAEKDGVRAVAYQADPMGTSYHDNCRAEAAWAERAMTRAGVPRYTLVKGWFADTLPAFDPGPIALLRLDSDWYQPTLECLEALHPLVVPGGLILIDDYDTWDGCTRAVHDYLSRHSLAERIRQTPRGVTYIVAESPCHPRAHRR
jgi:O-methyltransferase